MCRLKKQIAELEQALTNQSPRSNNAKFESLPYKNLLIYTGLGGSLILGMAFALSKNRLKLAQTVLQLSSRMTRYYKAIKFFM